jgi:hypothetical protein
MILTLVRTQFTSKSTIGLLDIDGVFFAYTLEDVVRTGPKVPGQTAIPEGTYPVIVSPSDRAKRGGLWTPSPDYLLPLLLNVTGFEGVRIHAGNGPEHTEGCILVGYKRSKDAISESRPALSALLAKMLGAPGAITLSVQS